MGGGKTYKTHRKIMKIKDAIWNVCATLLFALVLTDTPVSPQYKHGDLKSKLVHQLGAVLSFLSWLQISVSFWGRKNERKVKISVLCKIWKRLSINEWLLITLIIAIIYQALFFLTIVLNALYLI